MFLVGGEAVQDESSSSGPALGLAGSDGGAERAKDHGPLGIFEGHQDVGTVLHPGSVAYDAASRSYTVTGSGENMWQAKDAFHFVWKQASGDLAVTADVSFPAAGTEPHRKACLMIRQSLDAGSAYVDAALHGDGLTSLQFREAARSSHARGAGERVGPQAAAHREAWQICAPLCEL